MSLYYEQQLNCMIDALMHQSYSPSLQMGNSFRQMRVNAVTKALSRLNLFVPVTSEFRYSSSNDTCTGYSKPLNRDVIVLGCSAISADVQHLNRIYGEFRVRLPEPLGHLSQNYIFTNQAFAAATYSIFFPSPFILKASEQIAVDFGWNAPQAELETIAEIQNEVVFFCVSVKDCLSSEDLEILEDCKRVIRDNDYQRRVYLNAFTPGSVALTPDSNSQFFANRDNMIIYTPDFTRGVLTQAITRSADIPLLVIGHGTSGCASTMRVTDTGSGYSFTQNEFIYADQLFYPDENMETTPAPYYSYFRLPVPHLLKSGASMFTEFINGGGFAFPIDQNPRYQMWECLTP